MVTSPESSPTDNFVYPCYERDCISNLPNAILDLFNVKCSKPRLPLTELGEIGLETVSKVVLLVLDGFGFNQFLQRKSIFRFLSNLSCKGTVFPLTSVFPSQTTNALTTLNTGLMPQEHGLFEYLIYLKEAGQIVDSLSFTPISNPPHSYGSQTKVSNVSFKGKTIYTALKAAGIKSYTHAYRLHAYSACSNLLFEGSTIVPSLKSSDLVVNLRRTLEDSQGQAYFFAHFDTLDTIAHEYGPDSPEYSAELSVIFHLLSKELAEKIDPQTAKETLILVTADHGEANIAPELTTYLNQFPEVLKNLQCGGDGKPILPTGGPRDVFLHVKEEKLVETQDLLSKKIGDKAQILQTAEAVRKGFFGIGEASEAFLERAGNLMILPYSNETVWFEFFEGRKLNLRGHHGGLSKEEMLVPFGMAKLSDLK
ncbi:MAG: alkaline phosphatase family protein [Candidatus Bathyarchaeota archaeon]|nr:alkaline phosphatase family protein [Candidatus Bathyarchaeota archaeon]